VLKLNKPDDNHLPTWFENAESRFLSAGVSTEENRFNLFRDALSDEQTNAWGKFVSDAARTHSPYTHVKNALIKRYERRAHHRLFEIHNLRLKDGKSYVDFMDRLIATAGHDWETNPLKSNEIRTAFLQVLPTELFWKLNGLHDRDLLQLAADADASIHDSRKHAMYQHNAGAGSFPNLFSQSQSQSSHGSAGDAFSKLNAQMHEIQTSLSRVEAKTHKKWNNKYKNKNDGSQQSSRKDQSAPSRSQNSTTTQSEGNPEWCFYHNTYGERARKCKQPCSFNHDRPNVQQLHSKKLNKSSTNPFADMYNTHWCYYP